LRAFGTYALKATDPKALLKELVGTDGVVETDEVSELMRSIIMTAFADMLGEQKIAALDLAANYREMSEALRKYVCERVDDEYGLDVPQLFIVNISFPEDVEKALDTRTKMGVIGDMNRFQQYQMGEAMTTAAANPSGGAGAGVGLGMGFGMANQMAQNLGRAGTGAAVAPPPPPTDAWHIAVEGQTQGPFSAAQIADGISRGQVNAGTLLWSAGITNWTPAGQVPQFAPRLASPPPPPPK